MREVCFLVGGGDQLLWADASGSAVLLPDARVRWEAIWRHHTALVEITHSHPLGPLAFSDEDRTTMEALDQALGRRLVYSVVAPTGMIRCHAGAEWAVTEEEPWWAALLRLTSGMKTEG